MGILILAYHRINNDLLPDHLVISIEKFREHMSYLKDHCKVLSITNVCATYSVKDKWKEKDKPQVVITMDDGYRDNFQNAFPILKELHLPATVFLTTGMIGTAKVTKRYAHMPVPDMLGWKEIDLMQKGNIMFGAHTVSHPHLSTLNYEKQKYEIAQSIQTVCKRIGSVACQKIFCYPYGEYNEDTLNIIRELGIKIALTIKPGVNTQDDHLLELRRVSVDGNRDIADLIKSFNELQR